MPDCHVALIVPTRNAALSAEDFLRALQTQTFQPHSLWIIDSDSTDNTRDIFKRYEAKVLLIDSAEFDHGSTRQLAFEKCRQSSGIVIFMTQDALLADEVALEKLLSAFEDKAVGAAYGRQLPRKNANPQEAHARIFNYGPESLTKSLDFHLSQGIKACFISNSFAAYRCSALHQVGGFPTPNIVSEETFVAGKMLIAGWKIRYCADAKVYHSHNYSLKQEFQRYFDLGVFHCRASWIRIRFGQAEGEGWRFVLSQLAYLKNDNAHLIPSALLRLVIKYLGFRLGCCEAYLPNKIKVWLSMQKNYWVR